VVWYGYERDERPVSVSGVSVASLFSRSEVVHHVKPLRSILAALSDEEYATARDAVDRRRTTDTHRFAAAMLMPEQEDWVREAMKLHAVHGNRRFLCDSLWIMASSGEHAELAGVTRLDGSGGEEHVVNL